MQKLSGSATGVVAALVLVAGLLAGCGDGRRSGTASRRLDPATTELVYTYIGSSTPPPYHREYLLIVKQGSATISVGTYGVVDQQTKPIVTQTKSLSDDHWRALLGKVGESSDFDVPGCSGGESYALTSQQHGEAITHARVYTCGDEGRKEQAELAAKVSEATDLFDIPALLRQK